MKIRPIHVFKAIRNAMFFSAGIHMTILSVKTLMDGNIDRMNFFKILDITSVFPSIANIPYIEYISLLTIVLLFVVSLVVVVKLGSSKLND